MKYTPDFSSRFRILKGGKISLVVSALVAGSTITFASPTGGQVTSGSAAIAQNGSITTINQSSNKASINWNSFSIAPSETVNFVQPSAQSVTLNRVIGTTQSLIQGAMNANGQVFLLNPNGVLFANGSQVNVGGLVASTLNITDANFQAGNYVFEGNSQNSIINMGTITANNGYIAMMGKTVQNEGTIVATMGNVQMASGEKISLNLNGNSLVKLTIDQGTLNALVENKGLIQADGGQVYLTTQALNTILDGMVNNTGVIEAQSLNNVNGKVVLFAHAGTANVSGTIDATGGFVETSGKDLSVADGTVVKAKKWLLDPENVTIESGGTISAETINIYLAADRGSEDTNQMEIQATGDITVNQAVNILTDDVTVGGLTLIAGDNININNIITVGASANLTLNYGWDGVTAWNGSNEGTIYGNGGQITMGMTADKTAFTGKVSLGTTSAVYINEVEQIVIRDIAALEALSTGDMSGKYVLGSDLDMTGVDFTPIGYNLNNDDNDYTKEFKGNFNGLGNTISNLTISTDYNWDNYPDFKATGLFGNVSGGALISNIRLSHALVTNMAASNIYPTEVGALVGYARGQYDPNNNDAFVAAPTIHNNIVTDSAITSDGWNVGGIVGGAEDNVVLSNNAVTNVTSTGKGYVGGIAGYVSGNVKIDNAYVSASTITAGGAEAAGAITGSLQRQSELTNSYAQTNTITAKRDAGGLVGIIDDIGNDTSKPSTITNSFYKLDDTSINGVTGVISYGGIYANEASAWLAGNKADLSAATYLGAASGGFYTIDSAQDLKDMLGLVYNPANNFKLSTNLSLATGWYLPVLTGTFDGNSKTLTGLNVNQDYNANIGFVGRLLGGTVQNLTIAGATLNGYANVGGIAGVMRGNTFVLDAGSTRWGSFSDGATITGSHVTGLNYNIDKTFDSSWNNMDNGVGYESIGGLVGTAQSRSVISNSNSAGSITMDIKSDGFTSYVGPSSIGGLVGSAWGDGVAFDNVSSSVGITLKATALAANSDIGFENIGGLVGGMGGGDNTNAVLSNASASGAMSVTTKNFTDGGNDYYIGYIGGLVGYADGLDATTLSAANTITLKGDYIEYIGGIVGESYGANYDGMTRTGAITINPADATTDQHSEVYSIGGLIGYSEYDTIANATAAGTITLGTTTAPINYAESVGGAVGYADGTNIDTTVSSVVIAATNVEEGESFGGLVGYNGGYNDDLYKNTYQTTFRSGDLPTLYTDAKNTYLARADVQALLTQGYELYDSSYDGNTYYDIYFSMVKYNVELGNISNSSASGSIIAPNISGVGGLVGSNYLDGDAGAVITNSHATGEVQGLSDVGGLVGNNNGGNIVNSYATGKVTGTEENVGGLVGYNSGYDNTIWDSPFNVSDPIYDTPALAQAAMEAYVATYEAAHPGYIPNDVNNGTSLDDGTGKYYYYSNMQYYKDTSVGTITDSHATGEVVGHGASNVGGLIGYNYNDGSTGATITNSYATGAVKANGAESVGGLVGYNEYALIDSSYATGAVTANDSSPVGGLVGYDYEGTIANSHATGKVTVTNSGNAEKVGGLVGYTEFSSINGSYATGEVSAVGVDNVGGLVGEADNSHIETSYASSKVTGHDNVGGLVGFMLDSPTTILDSYAVGDVTGNDSVGGLVGLITDSTVTNTYASGAVTGTTNVGGLLGQVAGTTVNTSFYNSTKNPTVADNGFGTAKTTAEMNTLATYADAGWDIAEDSTLTKMFPQFGIGANIWVLNPVATIDPGTGVNVTPNNTVEQIQVNNVVTTIVNSTTVTPPAPVVVATVAPQPQQVQNQAQNNVLIQSIMPQGSTNGGSFGLVGSTDGITPVQTVTMEQLQTAATTQGIGEIRVPLANSSMVELVNGGVSLPVGVSQEFYVVASNDTLMDIEISNSNNKKAKK